MAKVCSGDDVLVVLNQASSVDTERKLEEWIEAEPSIAEDGLVVVGRQVPFDGGPAVLLAIDPQGRWVVIKIKRGRILRDRIDGLDPADPSTQELRDRLIEESDQLDKLARGVKEREAHASRKSLMEDYTMESTGKADDARRMRSRDKRDF